MVAGGGSGGSGGGGGLSRLSLLRNSLLVPAVLPLLLEGYSRAPPLQPESLPPLLLEGTSTPRDLVIVLPGSGGPDANTARILAALRPKAEVIEYDWRRFKGDELRAPYNAQRIGAELGRALARRADQPRSVHLVGISAGAFLADAIASSYAAAASPNRAHLHLTLCDAFTARGLAGLARPATAWGVRNFGRSADYCEALLNTDDPVPSTATPLRHAATFDLTDAAARRAFVPLPGDSLHSWPAAWYGLVGARTRPERPYHGAGGLPPRGAVVGVA